MKSLDKDYRLQNTELLQQSTGDLNFIIDYCYKDSILLYQKV